VDGEQHVVFRRSPSGRQDLDLAAGEVEQRIARGLEREHMLEQRSMTEASLRVEVVDDLLERIVLVDHHFRQAAFGVGKQGRERPTGIDLLTHWQRIDEIADERFDFSKAAVRRGHADDEVALPGIAEQHHLEDAEQELLRAHFVAPR
jgi:hypothetical protein